MYVYTYKNDVIIPDDAPNNPHDDDESSDDKNDYDYGDTDSMYRIDNFDEPNNTDDAYSVIFSSRKWTSYSQVSKM